MSSTTVSTTRWKDVPAVVPNNLTLLGQWAPIRAFRAVYGVATDPDDLPAPPITGDVALVNGTGAGAWAGHSNVLAEWNGANWTYTAAVEGLVVGCPPTQAYPLLIWNGSAWVPLPNHLFPQQLRVVTSTTYLTLEESTQVLVADASAGSFVVYLPAATSQREYRFHFVTGAGKSVTITPNGTDKVNGDGSLIFDNSHNYEHRHVVCYTAGKWACG